MPEPKWILVTGATGYIGGKLIPLLLARGYRVRCMARDAARLRGRAWYSQVEIVQGDLLVGDNLDQSMTGVAAAYYLIHHMTSGKGYPEREVDAARRFASAAECAGVEHIIYLGGLADPEASIAPHMRSRIQTGHTLRQGSVPVTEFRASVIIGPGSVSFEMIRYLMEQFPILPGPRWLRKCVQPIAIQNVLDYLLAALKIPACRGQVYEIGGTDVMIYAETMLLYARLRGLQRWVLIVPWVPLWLMAYLADKLTPVPARIAKPLIDSMRSDSVVRDDAARRAFPQVQPLGCQKAVSDALSKMSPAQIDPMWTDGTNSIMIRREGFLIVGQRINLEVQPEAVYRAFTGLGGKRGWLYLDGLWRLRGLLDRLIGGPGLRGRRDGDDLHEGETVDYYRVEALEPGRMMRLRAELKAPGDGWMEWRVGPLPNGSATLSLVSYFAPKGVLGFLYWYLLHPFHRLVFAGLLQRIARRARAIQNAG